MRPLQIPLLIPVVFFLQITLGINTANAAGGKNRITIEIIGAGIVISDPAGIDCPEDCISKFSPGSVVTLNAIPSIGQTFVGWSGACAGFSETCDINLSDQQKGTSVIAAFTAESATASAPVPQTGQTICVGPPGDGAIDCAGTGQDGEIQAGVVLPMPRFTDNGDGSVTDNLTGLHWLKDVGCVGNPSFADAPGVVADLNAGIDFSCTDYIPGTFSDWRVSNINELHSLTNYNFTNPPISNSQGAAKWSEGDPFVNIPVVVLGGPNQYLRSSTPTPQASPNDASVLGMNNIGELRNMSGSADPSIFIWPVRGPE